MIDWALRHWNELEGRALKDGILTTQGPFTLFELRTSHFFAFLEYVLSDSDEGLDFLEELNREPAGRTDQIMQAMMAFGGD